MSANKYYLCNNIYDANNGDHIPPEQVEEDKSNKIERKYELRGRTRSNLLRPNPTMSIVNLLSGTHIKIDFVDERYLVILNNFLSKSIIEIDLVHIQVEKAANSDLVKFNFICPINQIRTEDGMRGEKYDEKFYGTIDEIKDIDFQHFKLPNQPDNDNIFIIKKYTMFWNLIDTGNKNDFNMPLVASFNAIHDEKPPKPSNSKFIFNCTHLFDEEYCRNHGDFCDAVTIQYLDNVTN